jgi:hypothetical protein
VTRNTARSALPRLHPSDLAMAPELAALAIVESALHTAMLALVAEHPTLQDLAAPGEPASLRRARRLITAAATLDRALNRYRCAVYDAIAPLPSFHQDLPF